MRACTRRLLAGDTTVAAKLEALDLELDSHASKQVREEERNELWDLREAPANALCLARTRRLVPRDVSSSFHQGPQKIVRLGPARQRRRIPQTRAARLPHAGFVVGARFRERVIWHARGRPDAQVRLHAAGRGRVAGGLRRRAVHTMARRQGPRGRARGVAEGGEGSTGGVGGSGAARGAAAPMKRGARVRVLRRGARRPGRGGCGGRRGPGRRGDGLGVLRRAGAGTRTP